MLLRVGGQEWGVKRLRAMPPCSAEVHGPRVLPCALWEFNHVLWYADARHGDHN